MASSKIIKETLKIETMLKRAQKIEKEVKDVLKEARKPFHAAAKQRAPVEAPNLVRPQERHLNVSIINVTKVDGFEIKSTTKPNYKRGFGGRNAHLTEHGYQHKAGPRIPGKKWWEPAAIQNKPNAQKSVEKGVAKMYERLAK